MDSYSIYYLVDNAFPPQAVRSSHIKVSSESHTSKTTRVTFSERRTYVGAGVEEWSALGYYITGYSDGGRLKSYNPEITRGQILWCYHLETTKRNDRKTGSLLLFNWSLS